MTKIIYFDVENDEYDFLEKSNEGKFDYLLLDSSLNSLEKLDKNFIDAEIISVFTTSRIDKHVLSQFKNLKMIALRSVGFNHVDLEYCKRHKIAVVNTPNYGNKSVAEFAFGLMLDVCRKITYSCNQYKEMKIDSLALTGYELGGKTMGIVGLGAIGREFAKLAYCFEMNILGFDLRQNETVKEKYNVEYVEFERLLKESDFISLHAPLTKENKHMFDKKAFNLMKPTSVIINTARGELIETQALYNALIQKDIAGAGLDVLENEETIVDADYLVDIRRLNNSVLQQTVLNTRLQQLPNVVITPHIAYNTKEAINRILKTTMNNINEFLTGNLQNSVY